MPRQGVQGWRGLQAAEEAAQERALEGQCSLPSVPHGSHLHLSSCHVAGRSRRTGPAPGETGSTEEITPRTSREPGLKEVQN
jgi:hypothetical protein